MVLALLVPPVCLNAAFSPQPFALIAKLVSGKKIFKILDILRQYLVNKMLLKLASIVNTVEM